MPVYINKYRGNNYFSERIFADSIKLDHIPAEGLPVFRFETEDPAVPGSYRAGDFDLVVSLLQSEISAGGKSIRDFFLGEERDFYYLVILKISGMTFSGFARQSQVNADYTFTQNKWHVKLTCKDVLMEWANRCEAASNATINFANGEQLTFEEYIPRHFAGLTSTVVLIELPQKTYLERLRELYPNIQYCYALGDYRNFITGQDNISRWETFKELAKGLGFNFEMYVNEGTETTSEPEFIFKIFFISDLLEAEAIEPEIIEMSESISPPRLNWLFLKYRSIVFSEGEYSDGIFFSTDELYQSDTNHGDGVTLYPSCVLTFRGKALSYINENQVTEKMVMRDVDFTELPLKLYHYDLSTGAPIGKLYPLNEALGGGIAYARIFNCITGSGTIIDHYNFKPNQEITENIYSKFINYSLSTINLKIKLKNELDIKVSKLIKVYNNFYSISEINYYDVENSFMEIKCIKFK